MTDAVHPEAVLADPDTLGSIFSLVGEESLPVWIGRHDIEVDHRPFNFDKHRYLIDIYSCDAQEMAVMKAAQMGLTIYLLLYALHKIDTEGPIKLGFYFPTSDAIRALSKDRLSPLMLKNSQLSRLIDPTTFNDTIGLKQIGDSSLYLLHIGGLASKDSVPLDGVLFDEVRLMDPSDIDQTLERVSHSEKKYRRFVSTAGIPGQDIHARFMDGDQRYWHSKCLCGPNPEDWVCLPLHWPECVVDTGEEVFYVCPKCNARINNPQNGQFVAHNPGGKYPSFHISQLISDYITPQEVWDFYNRTTNIPEFWNAKLGLPYVDEENRPITDEIFNSCINTAIPWSWTVKELGPIGMGVDQRSGQNHVVIGQWIDGKKRIIHVELVDTDCDDYLRANEDGELIRVSPFVRLYELMEEFAVDCCVCDGLPNANEAQEFGRSFPRRVFLAYYQNQRDQVRWSDKAQGDKPGLKRVREDAKFEWHVLLDRYMSIEAALRAFTKRQVEFGDPRGLIQKIRNKEGRFVPTQLVVDRFKLHLKSVLRTRYNVREDGTYMMKWVNLGVDPHYTHAWNYCNAALDRTRPNFSYSFI